MSGPADPTARRIADWAAARDDVRAVLLTGSRARDAASVDELSDWDVILYVTDAEALLAADAWPSELGEVLVRLPAQGMPGGWQHPTRLVLYEDGTKIDFTVLPVDALGRAAVAPSLPEELDAGYRVLLDKDERTVSLSEPTFAAYLTHPPTQEQLTAVAEEFWWEATYVAKSLARGELLPARYSLEGVMKLDLLRRALEWRSVLDAGAPLRLGVLGRGLRARLPHEIWSRLEGTYLGPSPDEGWLALERTTSLFRDVTVDLAKRVELRYPHDIDAGVREQVERIRVTRLS